MSKESRMIMDMIPKLSILELLEIQQAVFDELNQRIRERERQARKGSPNLI
jgi:hypothetical protein